MTSIDLHGQIEPEARLNLQTFLVECRVKKTRQIKISHGYGQYVIRNMVMDVLKDFEGVSKYYPAHPSDGGAGITVVEFKW